MKIQLKETVLEYRAEDLAAWKRGDKSRLLEGEEVLPEIYTQPNYSFREYFVLNYFKKARWKGFCFYALGDWEVDNPKYERGRKKIKELFSEKHLSEFKKARERHKLAKGAGEPDLFLYMEGGPTLFLEVKKEKDRIRSVQLTTLAMIKSILGAEIGIVYLAKFGQQYAAKTYELDLDTFEGERCK
jgi:hypothetical protein